MLIINEKNQNYKGTYLLSIYKSNRYGFIHFFINHKLEVVSQVSKGIHTNTIENLWSHIKGDLKRTRSKHMFAIKLDLKLKYILNLLEHFNSFNQLDFIIKLLNHKK